MSRWPDRGPHSPLSRAEPSVNCGKSVLLVFDPELVGGASAAGDEETGYDRPVLAQRSQWPPHPQQPWMWPGSLLGLHWSPDTQAVSTEGTNGCWCVSPACPVGEERGGLCRLRRARACSHAHCFHHHQPAPRSPAGPWPLSAHPQLCRAQVLIGLERAVTGGQCPCRTWTGSERSAEGRRAVAGL